MRTGILACAALALLAGCGGGGSYGPAADGGTGGPPVDPPVDPPGPLVVLDLATGAIADATGDPVLAGDRIYFRRVGGTAELSAGDAVSEIGTDDTTTIVDVADCWISVHEVSQEQWTRLAASAPAHAAPWSSYAAVGAFGGAAAVAGAKPAFGVSWQALQAVLAGWNGGAGHVQLRAPSAVEWEYACRSGAETPTRYAWGSSESAATAGAMARVRETRGAGLGPAACGSLLANAAGFHDMAGNVWEWVAGDVPELRGGSWYDNLRSAASGNRLALDPDIPYPTAGVRLVLEAP